MPNEFNRFTHFGERIIVLLLLKKYKTVSVAFWPKSEGAISLPSSPISRLSDTCLFSSAEKQFCIDKLIPPQPSCFASPTVKEGYLCAARKIGLVEYKSGLKIVEAKLMQLINDAPLITKKDTNRFLIDVPPNCRFWNPCFAKYRCDK